MDGAFRLSGGLRDGGRTRIPYPVIVLFAIDFALCTSYVINDLLGGPSRQLTRLLDLNGESNLPTWYSSIQLFSVSVLLGLFAFRNTGRSPGRSWALPLFPLMLLAFSVDEIAMIHEWVGDKLDVLLPTGDRKDTVFRETGIWFFVVGGPVLLGSLAALAALRSYFSSAPHAFRKFLLGILLFFAGAIGVEALSNIPDRGTFGFVLENFFEEGLEMAGVTVVFWAACDLLTAYGFAWTLDAADNASRDDDPVA